VLCRLLHAVMLSVVAAVFKRREHRATAWLSHAITNFRDSTEAGDLRVTLGNHLRALENAFTLCSATCNDCRLPCQQIGTHSDHSCGTDHKCKQFCQFCIDEGCAQRACKEKAGHIGRHMCADVSHACGMPCALRAALNCDGTCRKLPGHEGDCDCQSGNHLCGATCDLPGCGGKCVAPYGAVHDCHACENTHCPEVRNISRVLQRVILWEGLSVLSDMIHPVSVRNQQERTTVSVACSCAHCVGGHVPKTTSMLPKSLALTTCAAVSMHALTPVTDHSANAAAQARVPSRHSCRRWRRGASGASAMTSSTSG
jgi:hypothetical protein